MTNSARASLSARRAAMISVRKARVRTSGDLSRRKRRWPSSRKLPSVSGVVRSNLHNWAIASFCGSPIAWTKAASNAQGSRKTADAASCTLAFAISCLRGSAFRTGAIVSGSCSAAPTVGIVSFERKASDACTCRLNPASFRQNALSISAPAWPRISKTAFSGSRRPIASLVMIGNMDVKLLIAAGDEVTAAYWSGELGKQYERREGWGTSTGARGGSRTRQGRWELQPIITSDAMGRLDPEKAVLLMRGHAGALIDKAFCLKEAGFKRQVQASEAFRSKLTIPRVGAAEQEPPTIAPVLKADPRRHEIAKARVQEAASTVFLDPRAFEAAFVQAMGAPQNEAI